jgi:hypothetical protein
VRSLFSRDTKEEIVKRLTAQDWYDVADLFNSAGDFTEETGGDSGLNSALAHEKATKMLLVLSQKAHNRGLRLEAKKKSNSN